MPTTIEAKPVSKPALFMGRLVSGLVILFLLFDGAMKLAPCTPLAPFEVSTATPSVKRSTVPSI